VSRADDQWTPIENAEAEMCTLGCMLLSERGLTEVRSLIRDEDFYRPVHKELFRAMLRVHDSGSVVDMLTLSHELSARNIYDKVGGLAYLIQIQEAVPSAHNAQYYAQIVADLAMLRRCEQHGRMTVSLVRDPEMEPHDKVRKIQESAVSLRTGQKFAFSVRDVLSEARDRPKWAVPTGFSKIDDVTLRNGLGGGKMHIVGGETGQGKSYLACQLVRIACEQGLRTCFVSLEMDRHDMVDRFVQQATGFRDRAEADYCGEVEAWDAAARQVEEWDLVIVDSSSLEEGMSVENLCAWLAAQHMIEEWQYVLVDFAQLLTTIAKIKDEWQGVKHAANKLRLFAMNFGPVVVLIVQIEKDRERGHRVIGSQYLEKLASTFFFLDRAGIDEAGRPLGPDMMYLKKNRYGQSKIKFEIEFNKQYCVFRQVEPADPFRDDVRDNNVRTRQERRERQSSIFRGSTDE